MDKKIVQLMADSNYSLEQFTNEEINKVEKQITHKTNKKGDVIYYVHCGIRDKDVRLTPEELVRQLYIVKLMDTYMYPKERMELEYSVSFGREKKRADIVIFDKDNVLSLIHI